MFARTADRKQILAPVSPLLADESGQVVSRSSANCVMWCAAGS